jgi:hypothetical protein
MLVGLSPNTVYQIKFISVAIILHLPQPVNIIWIDQRCQHMAAYLRPRALQKTGRIELNGASGKSCRIYSMENSVQLELTAKLCVSSSSPRRRIPGCMENHRCRDHCFWRGLRKSTQ